MARKQSDQLTKKEKQIISDRIGQLFEEYKDKNPEITQKKLAEKIGISPSTVSRIFNPDSVDNYITLSNLMKISRFFKVNMDYLIGRSASRTAAAEDRAITERLQLSDLAVSNLITCKNKRALLDLFESKRFNDFAFLLDLFMYQTNKAQFLLKFDPEGNITDEYHLKSNSVKNIFLQDINDLLNEMRKNNGKK